jgi:hypothetical protein
VTLPQDIEGFKGTPGSWEYVPATEHHGPYIVSEYGGTICDFYVMSKPSELSTLNGGPSKPIAHCAEMAGPNARLAASAPDLLEAAILALRALEGIDKLLHQHGMMGGVSCPAIAWLETAISRALGKDQ